MSNSEDNNTNGLTSDPLNRLASLKAPRDLSLGGVKPNKKVFIPNLNVTRNKNKGPSATNYRDKKDDKGRRDRKNKEFKNGPKVIKSSGVFSEGLGSVERHTSHRSSYGRDSDPAPALKRPTIRVKDVIKIDKELEEEKIKAAFGSEGAYDEECEDFKNVLDIEAPVKLPMDDGGWPHKQKPAVKIKQEVVVKQEPTEDGDCPNKNVVVVTVDEKKPDTKEVFEDTNVANVLRSDKRSLILLQLSDALPGRGGSDDDRKRQEPGSSSEPDKPADARCCLSDLEEGKVGKLRIHRSGKVTLALGDTIFEVCSGTKASFYQEAVSVAVDDQSRSANLVSLGPIQHKLNVTPDWEQLFNNMAV